MSQKKNNTSFSLLNQEEIDTLIDFLTTKKNTINSDTLSQTSIDKLIMLFQSDKDRLALNYAMAFRDLDSSLLKKLDFRNSISEVCELRCSIDENTKQLILTAYNQETGKKLVLTPKLINSEDGEEWGFSMPPTFFNHIAYALSLKYTQETYDFICNVYAEHNFGSASHKIPEMYLLSNDVLLDCLL